MAQQLLFKEWKVVFRIGMCLIKQPPFNCFICELDTVLKRDKAIKTKIVNVVAGAKAFLGHLVLKEGNNPMGSTPK